MQNILVRIKRAVLAGNYAFSEKARLEMEADSLTELDVAESIGKLVTEPDVEKYYFFISSKKAI